MSEEVQNDGSTKPAQLDRDSAAPVAAALPAHPALPVPDPPDHHDASINVSQTSITQVNTDIIILLTNIT